MFKLFLCLCLLCSSVCIGQDSPTVKVFVLNKSTKSIVESLINDSHGDGNLTIPDIVKKAPIIIQTQFYPRDGYYRVDISLLSGYNRVCGFWKCLEVWSDRTNGKTIVRSTIDVQLHYSRCRFVNKIKEFVINKIENEILNVEHNFIKDLE